MVMLTRKRQLAGKVEDDPGTLVALAAADAKALPIDPKAPPDVEMYNREVVRPTLSKEGMISGIRRLPITFSLEQRGSGTGGTAPDWLKYWLACGFESRIVGSITGGAIVGTFTHLEVVTQAVSGASGIILFTPTVGETVIYFIDTYAAAWDNTNVVTGASSGATFTPAAAVLDTTEGHAISPFSHDVQVTPIGVIAGGPFQEGEVIQALAGSLARGIMLEATITGAPELRFFPLPGPTFLNAEVITGATSGATATTSAVATQGPNPTMSMQVNKDGRITRGYGFRGGVKGSYKVGEPGILAFDMMGVFDTEEDEAKLAADYEDTTPPILLAASLAMDAFASIVTTLEVDYGTTKTPRDSVNAAAGMLHTILTERDWSITIDPEAVHEVTKDWMTEWTSDSQFVLEFTLGSAAGNRFKHYFPSVQIEKKDDTDRDGIQTDGFTLRPTRYADAGDDEVLILIH